jgi:hypothetical protein
MCLVLLNDEQNCRVSRIFMNPRPFHVKTLQKWTQHSVRKQ